MSVPRYKLIFILIFFIHHRANANDPHAPVFSRPGSRGGASNLAQDTKSRSSIFSPRLDYNEWLPVGRGDPLKNDPTYDYSPPVLDRVRYWPENLANKDKGSDILLLGVPSKKSSSKADQQYQQPWANSGPVRRTYYHHQINQLPTVLMPPPLSNHIQQEGSDGYLWAQASTNHPQRFESQAEGFRYKPGPASYPAHSFVNQYSGPKHTDVPLHQMTSYQPQQQQQSHHNHPYTTTIRLVTPNDLSQKKPILHTILQNEKAYPFTKSTVTSAITEYTPSFYNPQSINAMATTIIHPPQTTEYLTSETSNDIPAVSVNIRAPAVTPTAFMAAMTTTRSDTTSTTTVTPPPSVTADSLFSHYNQPPRPPKSPLYLIIEGHSKVKTYGLNNNNTLLRPPMMVPVASSEDPVNRRVVNRAESGDEMEVSHISMKLTTSTTTAAPPASDEESSAEKSAIDSLLGLLESSFGGYLLRGDSGGNAIDSAEGDKDSKARRNARDIRGWSQQQQQQQRQKQQVFVEGSFLVGEKSCSESAAFDCYRKGVVLDESATIIEDAFKY
ncbi:uncharacterized protein LOC131679058 [Topomyia yanbarensis]|uniref:uncharacterized protein LOC131679058 n=1 Tax=Topomyia yanbarensis TaxID=2498891 RepID=UPI00273C2562|nr:uncharacterized protein LOC131679058 [Topomyia yanbarensis]XP_058815593.1 uncharacterized protein LOC131679058 [Topomyia yanbarensis]